MVSQNHLVSLSQARQRLIPRRPDGKPVAPSTVWRWIKKGLAGPDGARIRLEVTYVGRRPYVSAEAIRDFFTEVTTARLNSPLPSTANDTASVEDLENAGLI